MTPLVETKGVSKHYGAFPRARRCLACPSREGEFVSIVGPNGAGKTTLVNLLTGLLVPTKGEVYFKGSNIAGVGPVALADARHGPHLPARADLSAADRGRDHRRRRRHPPGQAVAAVLDRMPGMPRSPPASRRSPASSASGAPPGDRCRACSSQGEKKLLDVASAFALDPR